MEMWGNGSYHKSNSGVMALTSKSKNWDVNGDSVVAIPAAIPVVTQITGISRNGNAAQITFMWHWVPNPQLSDLANADQVLFAKINRLEQSNSTGLELFDDGWRTGNPMFETYSFGEQHRTVVLGSCN